MRTDSPKKLYILDINGYDSEIEAYRETHNPFYSFIHQGGSGGRWGDFLKASFLIENGKRQISEIGETLSTGDKAGTRAVS
jgi:hypothetical protein